MNKIILRVFVYVLGVAFVLVSVMTDSTGLGAHNPIYHYIGSALWIGLAVTGLIFFFRLRFHRDQLSWWGYVGWLFLLTLVTYGILLIILYLQHQTAVFSQHASLAEDLRIIYQGNQPTEILLTAYGLILMGFAGVPGSSMRDLGRDLHLPGSSLWRHRQRLEEEDYSPMNRQISQEEWEIAQKARRFQSSKPQYQLADLFLPPALLQELCQAVDVAHAPRTSATEGCVALHLYGKPGTGKTMAAHALAHYLGKEAILVVNYPDMDGTNLSEEAKNTRAIFYAAERDDALILVDRADDLFSADTLHQSYYLDTVHMINMHIRIALEQFRGVIIFTTDMIANYNRVLETHVRHIHLPMPAEAERQKIWEVALTQATLPLAEGITSAALARQWTELSGREITRIVNEAEPLAREEARDHLAQRDLDEAATRLLRERISETSSRPGGDIASEGAGRFQSSKPLYQLADLFLPEDLRAELCQAVDVLRLSRDLSAKWVLPEEAQPSYVALHLYGKPGTGKTMAAHALAHYLGKEAILVVRANDITSGDSFSDGAKAIREIFSAAATNNALILLDEADALFSTDVPQTIVMFEFVQRVNVQLRASLEQFRGVIIFTTDIIGKYNRALETRVQHFHLPMPAEAERQRIWEAALAQTTLPRAAEVESAALARQFEELSGREIRRLVAEAVQMVLAEQRDQLEWGDLQTVVTRLIRKRLHPDSGTIEAQNEAKQYVAQDPEFAWERLVLPQNVEEDLEVAVNAILNEQVLFTKWGLHKIEPHPKVALNFHGEPGTGKTMAAHALAQRLGRKILVSSYGEIQSKWLAEGEQNIINIFRTAERENAVLLIDEADSLVGQRLGGAVEAWDKSRNETSNQMLVCVERFRGVVIFATNMAQNYDKAFETRMHSIYFPQPDEECRRRLWEVHLPAELPRAPEVKAETLARQIDGVCGRDIKNAVLEAASRAQFAGREWIELSDLVASTTRIKRTRISQTGEPASDPVQQDALVRIREKLTRYVEKAAPTPSTDLEPVEATTPTLSVTPDGLEEPAEWDTPTQALPR